MIPVTGAGFDGVSRRAAPARPAVAAVLAALVSGCGGAGDSAGAGDPTAETPAAARGIEPGGEGGGYRGLELATPIRVPAFTLTDTSGEPYDFLEETAGSLAFLFFGFTHCPDICPVQLANLAAALGDLPYAERRQVEVVFVTTDPERDTPDVVRGYLDRFDREFTGLVAPIEEVNAVLASLDLPPAVKEEVPGTGDYTVGHVAQIMAVTGDGMIRLAYPGGIRQSDWRNDLPALLRLNAAVTGGETGD